MAAGVAAGAVFVFMPVRTCPGGTFSERVPSCPASSVLWDSSHKGDEEECGCGCSHDEGSCEDSDGDVIPSDDPIVLEVERLIAAYSDRFDELCKENGEVPEEALTYKPRTPIEQVAFDIFTDALHDSLMDEDDE